MMASHFHQFVDPAPRWTPRLVTAPASDLDNALEAQACFGTLRAKLLLSDIQANAEPGSFIWWAALGAADDLPEGMEELIDLLSQDDDDDDPDGRDGWDDDDPNHWSDADKRRIFG